ncbi:maker656, partial [Drosophila busckii]
MKVYAIIIWKNLILCALDMSAAAANKPEGRKNVKLFDLFNDEPKVTVQKINQSHTVVTTT